MEDEGDVRVYVGGLPADAAPAELQERFSRALSAADCRVARVELPPPKGLLAPAPRGFAYLTLVGGGAQAGAELLARTFHRTKWRGAVLRVERARPDFLAQLRAEWASQRAAADAAAAARAAAMTPAPASAEAVAALRVGGVAFCGSRRTSFEYEDVDWEAAFAAKKQVVVAKTQPVVATMEDVTESESSDGREQSGEDDDADYWATSGDEAEEENQHQHQQQQEVETVAVDDVEAFVRQVMELEPEEQQQDDDSSSGGDVSDDDEEELEALPSVKGTDAHGAPPADSTSNGSMQVDENDVESYVQQVEREEANARRIAALDAKRKQKQQQQQLAVKIDLSATSGKKITFDDSGNEQEDGHEDGDGGSGAAITNWLDSSDEEEEEEKKKDFSELRDGSDDEDGGTATRKKQQQRNAFEFGDGDDDDVGKAFAVRPEFLGERGKKLFELQKRFGGDQRFRMDARFIEDEENEYGGMDGLVDDDDDAGDNVLDGPTGELQEFLEEDGADAAAAHEREWLQEQDTALLAIAGIFPDVDIEGIKYRLRVKVKKDPIKEASWMGQMKRYDPRDAHARHEYELPLENESKKTGQQQQRGDGGNAAADAEQDARKKQREEKEVLVGGDRFFSTSSSLGSMFTRVRKNSEDGVAGEAALDGVFGFSRGFDDEAAGGVEGGADGAATGGGSAATFKLSSLFDFPVEEEKAKNSQLAAMGETLFEEEEDAADGEKPWHFTQSFFSDEKDDVPMDTDNEDEGGDEDGDDDGTAASDDDNGGDGKASSKKKALKKSLAEFLAFGKTFMSPQDGSTNPKSKEWTEKRKRLTLDFKRKRKDALRNKKKLQQRLQKQHKKQKTAR